MCAQKIKIEAIERVVLACRRANPFSIPVFEGKTSEIRIFVEFYLYPDLLSVLRIRDVDV
jgi:hypothetical protein